MWPVRTALTLAFLLSSFALASAAFFETQAYHIQFNTGTYDDLGTGMDVDGGGNVYLWYKAVETHNDFYRLARIDPGGRLSALSTYQLANPNSVGGDCKVGADGKIYTFVNDTFGGHKQSVIYKFSSAGALLWSIPISSGTQDFTTLAVDADASGNVYAAVNYNGGTTYLASALYDSSGHYLGATYNDDITPLKAFHSGHTWVVSGTATIASVLGTRWGIYSDSTCLDLAGKTIQNVYGTGYSNTFLFTVYPTSFSQILVVENETGLGSHPPEYGHSLAAYNLSGGLLWNDGGLSNYYCGSFGGEGASGPYFAETAASPTVHGDQVSSWNTSGVGGYGAGLPSDSILCDHTGFFAFLSGTSSLSVERYDSGFVTGPYPRWNNTIPFTGSHGSNFFAYKEVNGVLYIGSNLSMSSTGYDVNVQRWVSALALSSLSANASSTVHSGGTYDLKVSLNTTPASGGVSVALTSNNPKLLFDTGTQTKTVIVPAGQQFVLTTLHALTIPTAQYATVTGTSNGITRSTAVALQP